MDIHRSRWITYRWLDWKNCGLNNSSVIFLRALKESSWKWPTLYGLWISKSQWSMATTPLVCHWKTKMCPKCPKIGQWQSSKCSTWRRSFRKKQMFNEDYISFMNDMKKQRLCCKSPRWRLKPEWLFKEVESTSGIRLWGFLPRNPTLNEDKQSDLHLNKVPSRASRSNGECGINVPPGEGPTSGHWPSQVPVVAKQWCFTRAARIQDGGPLVWCHLLAKLL